MVRCEAIAGYTQSRYDLPAATDRQVLWVITGEPERPQGPGKSRQPGNQAGRMPRSMAFICINVKMSQVIGIGPQDAILLVKTISGRSDAGFAL